MSVLFLQKPSTKVGWQREESQEQEVFLFLSGSLELELFSIPCPALMSFACREGVVENQCLERDSFCPSIYLVALIYLTRALSQDRTLKSKYTSLGAVFSHLETQENWSVWRGYMALSTCASPLVFTLLYLESIC